jgi:hypothetical protein
MNIVERWQDLNRATNTEGSTGVKNIEKLCKSMGYGDSHGFYESNPLIGFFADNPGAIEAVTEWIIENLGDEQRLNLINDLPYQEPTIEWADDSCPDCDSDSIDDLEPMDHDSGKVPVKTCNNCGQVWFIPLSLV